MIMKPKKSHKGAGGLGGKKGRRTTRKKIL
jgi:hypothetical protein